MYERRYVKRRVRRAFIAIIAGFSLTGGTAMGIVAFLGRFVGTFTVSLDNSNVSLALSLDPGFPSYESYLRVDRLPLYREITYTDIESDDLIDSEETDYLYGLVDEDGDSEGRLRYFKYTFFVRNVGETTTRYTFKVFASENTLSSDGRSLIDTARIMIFANEYTSDGPITHDKTVYAKQREEVYLDGQGNPEWREPISVRESYASSASPFQGYAERFLSDTLLIQQEVGDFQKGDTMRYTLVTWLEGNDAQSNRFEAAPEGATLKLGVEINAYEN